MEVTKCVLFILFKTSLINYLQGKTNLAQSKDCVILCVRHYVTGKLYFIRTGINPSTCVDSDLFKQSLHKIIIPVFCFMVRWNDLKSRQIIYKNSKNGSFCSGFLLMRNGMLKPYTQRNTEQNISIRSIGMLNCYMAKNDDVGESFKLFYLDIKLSIQQVDYLNSRQCVRLDSFWSKISHVVLGGVSITSCSRGESAVDSYQLYESTVQQTIHGNC